MSENNTDLNEVFEEEMADADVITVPIDETLSNSGEAADAAAVGAALALKADKDELPATIKVNNQPADNQGLILIDGTDIPVSDSNTKTLAEAIEEASEMTAATIPMTGETGAATIGETIGVLQETVEGIAGNMSADKIPMSEAEDAETIAEAIGIIADNVEELAETVEGMEQKTADKVLMETGSTVTVKDAIETLDRTAVKSVNRKLPDASGDVDLSVVPLAENLQSDKLQSIEGEFTLRTTGGTGSVSDGKAYPQHIYGNSRHDGFVAEVLNLTVIPIARTEPDEPITATIDRDTFLEEVEDSDTINLYYTTEWSEDPADYGVTVTGDPVAGDQITIVYVKEVRGTIVVAEPDRLVGTGWNLFNYNAGYARVVKYSETYGYKIGGTFTSIAFAASLTDDRISLLPNIDGLFSVPGDGYVFVTGGNNTDTYILTTWSDWIEGPSTGYWEAYRESGIDLSAVVETYFPYGMLKVGTVRDEIDLVAKRTISRIERMVYNEENRATAAATGREYDFDENNIYVVRAEPVLNAITIDSEYSVSEHGLEWFTETGLPLDTEILYGKNLRDKLERNVLTISAQTLTEEEKSQVRTNIGAMSQAEGDTKLVAPTEAGMAGQLLHLKEDGSTEWTTQGTPTDAQVGTAVSAWLAAHPEATTTVEDGAISRAKLNDDLKAKTDAVPDLKSAFANEAISVIDDILNVSKVTIHKTFTAGKKISSTGRVSDDTYRIATVDPIDITTAKVLEYNIATGYQSYIATYSELPANENQKVATYGWLTGTGSITLGATEKYLKISINTTGGSTVLSPSDADKAVFSYTTKYYNDLIAALTNSYHTLMGDAGNLTALSANDDLNNITAPGTYKCTSTETASTIANRPAGVNGEFTLLAINSVFSSYTFQLFIPFRTGALYSRAKNRDGWQAWNKYGSHDIESLINGVEAEIETNVDSIDESYSLLLEGKNNVLDYSTITAGKRIRWSTGTIDDAGTLSISDYIPIRHGMKMLLSFSVSNTSYGNAYYDANKEYISGEACNAEDGVYDAVPEGSAYVRLTIPNTELVSGSETATVRITTDLLRSLTNTLPVIVEKTKWLAIGDSITFGVYSYTEGGVSDEDVTTECWVRLLASASSYDLTIMASRGMGYVRKGKDPLNPSGDEISLDTLLTRIEALTDDYNLITMMFGINDYATASSSATIANIESHLNDAIQRLSVKFPHARLVVITPFNSCRAGDVSSNFAYLTENRGQTLKQIADAIKARCEAYGVECFYATNGFLFNAFNIEELQPDKTHPSLTAHRLIAKDMAHLLLN